MFGKNSVEAALCFSQGSCLWGHVMSMCLIAGDVNVNHLVTVVSARFPLKNYYFPLSN